MLEGYDIEIMKSAMKLVRDVLKVSTGEEVAITYDTQSDYRVVKAIAQAVSIIGGKPITIWIEAPPIVGKAADRYIPIRTLSAVLKNADVWIELNKSWLLYSTPYEEAMIENKKLRYICLVGMDADMMVRTIGRVNIELIYEFQRKLAEITHRSRKMRITTPAGTNVEFENDPSRPVLVEGEVTGPGEYMLFGQVDWAPIEESINGVIVFDGSVWPPQELGILRNPIKLYVENGIVKRVEGSWEAKVFEKWLKSFEDPKMFMIAHISYGCNPGAKLTGNILEDERIWGAVEWGLGSQSQTFRGKLGMASSHTDGVCLNPTVIGDDIKIIENGEYVHPELAKLVERLKSSI